MQRNNRIQRELMQLINEPPFGVFCWTNDDSRIDKIEAAIDGPQSSPYEGGIFKIEVCIPERYPFEPPKITFATPIYHPNIDTAGRICFDPLKMPPKGQWKPSLNLSTVLGSLRHLLYEANPDDGLMDDISAEYKMDRASFDRHAKAYTHKYAISSEGKEFAKVVNEGGASKKLEKSAQNGKMRHEHDTNLSSSKLKMTVSGEKRAGKLSLKKKEANRSSKNSTCSRKVDEKEDSIGENSTTNSKFENKGQEKVEQSKATSGIDGVAKSKKESCLEKPVVNVPVGTNVDESAEKNISEKPVKNASSVGVNEEASKENSGIKETGKKSETKKSVVQSSVGALNTAATPLSKVKQQPLAEMPLSSNENIQMPIASGDLLQKRTKKRKNLSMKKRKV
eukprot:Nk52_evm7s224 gene=Nk52_evmTU7s224